MSQTENDPEVQRNGIELYGERFNLPEKVLERFKDKHFDPSEPWSVNNRRFWDWFKAAIPNCPNCGDTVTGAEIADEEPIQVRMVPCGHVVDDSQIDIEADIDAL